MPRCLGQHHHRKPGESAEKAAGESNSQHQNLGCSRLQYCWGAKMISVASSGPASLPQLRLRPALEMIEIPMCVLVSKKEPVEEFENYEEALTGVN
jgi:hypothetical protein